MKVVSVSDIHGNIDLGKYPEGDILTISGDICPAWGGHGMARQYHWLKNHFVPWCEKKIQEGCYKHIVFCAGNHDHAGVFSKIYDNKSNHYVSLPDNVHYLQDKSVNIDGIEIYGTPWTPLFMTWHYMLTEDKLDKKFSKIPENIDILLSHGPAYGYGDVVLDQNAVWCTPDKLGSKALLKHIRRSGVKRLLHGHIHSGDHAEYQIENDHNNVIVSRNVSLIDERYSLAYEPYEFEI